MKDHASKKDRKTNLIFAGVLLLAALALALWAYQRPAAATAVLTYGDDNQRMELPLNKNEVYHVDTGHYTVNIQVQDGAARFVDSPCPDHLCEGFGWLRKDGDTATCLPARANLVVMTET